MICQVIVLDTTGTTYTFYEREKTKETKKYTLGTRYEGMHGEVRSRQSAIESSAY